MFYEALFPIIGNAGVKNSFELIGNNVNIISTRRHKRKQDKTIFWKVPWIGNMLSVQPSDAYGMRGGRRSYGQAYTF